jgi:peptidoglycan hydrolase-like protein with peptidoglycan-binding domain
MTSQSSLIKHKAARRALPLAAAALMAVGFSGLSASPASAAIIPGRCEFTSSQPQLSYAPNTYKVAVKQLQCELNYSMVSVTLKRDGYFGSDTQAAVIKLQRCTGIDDDGIAGPNTWAKANYWARSNSYAC